MRTPSYWKGMSFSAKAEWLLSTNQAKTYSEACAMLARLPRRKKQAVAQPATPQNYWWQS